MKCNLSKNIVPILNKYIPINGVEGGDMVNR